MRALKMRAGKGVEGTMGGRGCSAIQACSFIFLVFYLATEFSMCLTLWHIRILTGAEDLYPPQPHAPGLGLFEAREVPAASQALSAMFCN